jgi:serine/threonine protein kinase
MSQCLNPVCGKSNLVGEKFCSKCGSKLLLADRYRATEFLGQGGFGRTFKAMDEYRLQTRCVIKQFLPLHHGSKALKKSKELFEQEAIQLCALGKHPQIPDLLAFFEQEGKLYLIQDLIEGEDLLKELRSKGFYNEAKTRDFLVQLLPVLQFIHEKNVIHRDIKPENIIRRSTPLVFDNGEVSNSRDLVLIDFGVSKHINTTIMGEIGTITGTHGYSAPEQLRGMSQPSSDIYSLGVTAIRLLTGCIPLEKNGSIRDPIFDPQTLTWKWKEWLYNRQIHLTPEFLAILDQMLQEKISDRFQSATEVLEALNPPKLSDNPSQSSPSLGKMIGGYWHKTVNLVKEKLSNTPEITNPHPKAQNISPQIQPITPISQEKNTTPTLPPSPQNIASIPSPTLPSSPQNIASIPSPTLPSSPQNIAPIPPQNLKPQAPIIISPVIHSISLKTSLGIDYSNLEKNLDQKQWKQADIETYKLLLKIAGRQGDGWLRPTDIIQLSSIDLQTINSLWNSYSQQRFCFNTQKKIYKLLKGTPQYDENIWNLFAQQVGWLNQGKWLNYNELNFSFNAPLGHLPFGGWLYRLNNVNRPAIFLTFLFRGDI